MKHIWHAGDAGWQMDAYFQYLSDVRERLPVPVYAFAANVGNYDQTTHQSLHDSWIESLQVQEVATEPRFKKRQTQIELALLGPFHDLRIHINYRNVTSYRIEKPSPPKGPPKATTWHGDLLMHEVRMGDSAGVEHELEFSSGAIIVIACETFEHRLEPF